MSRGASPLVIKHQRTAVGFDDLVKTAGSRLSGDARLWPSEITAQIASEHPYVPVEQITVNFTRIDPVKGAAVGVAKVGSDDSSVQIPLVIKRKDGASEPELAPVDVVQVNGRYRPLNESTIMGALAEKARGTSLPKQQGQGATQSNPYIGDVTGDSTPLEYGGQGTPYAGPYAVKSASVLDKLARDGVDDDGRTKRILLENPEILQIAEGKTADGVGILRKAAGIRSFAQKSPYHFGATSGGIIGGIHGAIGGLRRGGVLGAASGAAKGALKGAASGLLAATVKEELNKRAGNDVSHTRALNASTPSNVSGSTVSSFGTPDLAMSRRGPGLAMPGVKLTNPSVMVVYLDAMGDIYVKFTGGPSERIRSADDLKSMLGGNLRECLRSLETNRVYVATNDVQPVSWSAARQDASTARPITGSGMHSVQDKTGNTHVGFVVNDVVGLDGRSTKQKLFVAPGGGYALAEEMFGLKIGSNKMQHVPASQIKPRSFGTFISYAQGKPLAISPMFLRSKFRLSSSTGPVHSREKTVYVVEDSLTGIRSSLIQTSAVVSPMRAADIDTSFAAVLEGVVYLIPADSEWVQLNERLPISSSADEVVKTARESSVTRVCHGGGTYSISREGKDWQRLDAPSLFCLLADMGVTSPSDLADIEKQAREAHGEWVGLIGLREPEMRKMACEVVPPNSYPLLERLTGEMRPSVDLIKAASEVGGQTLDAVLSLNFITPSSVEAFTDSIDTFDDVSSKLAELLIATRLGLGHVREAPVKTAMEGIAKAVDQLKILKSASEFSRKNE